MTRTKYPIKRFRELAQAFGAAHEDHYTLALTGSLHRLYRTGFVLRKLTREGEILSQQWGRRKVFICKRRAKSQDEYPYYKIPHALTCTEILVRLYLSKYGLLLSNADFSRQPCVPDGGVRYPDGSEILFEYSTKDNFSRKTLMAEKIAHYQEERVIASFCLSSKQSGRSWWSLSKTILRLFGFATSKLS